MFVCKGVLTGDNVIKLFKYASEHQFAIPAFNVTSSSSINAVLEAARDAKAPVIVQISQGGAQFFAGKGLNNDGQKGSILGSIAAAHHVRTVAKSYGVPVVLHSGHCAKKLEPWFVGMLEADEAYFKEHGEPLFSSHMLDFSEESKEHNLDACKKYLTRMAPMKIWLEMEIGITGGEEDGVDILVLIMLNSILNQKIFGIFNENYRKLLHIFQLLLLLVMFMVFINQEMFVFIRNYLANIKLLLKNN